MNDALTCLRQRDAFLGEVGVRPLIMGILNITPDSFSDGGRFASPQAAIAQTRKLTDEGADILDVGAESTRPGAIAVTENEELARIDALMPIVRAATHLPISIDTYKAKVAARGVALGACIINDVWGLQHDPAMAATVAQTGAGVVIMHNRAGIDSDLDILSDMRRFFDKSLAMAARENIPRRHIMLDPGIGFGKTQNQNLQALQGLHYFDDYQLPMLIGVSRKSLLGKLLDSAVDQRLIGTLSANLACAARGAKIFRVHDVAEHRAAFRVSEAIHHGHS